MKKLRIWSMLMLMVMALPMMVACGGDDSEDDNSLPFTKEMIIGDTFYWDITEVTGNNSRMRKGASAQFYADGTCKGFYSMETSWEIKGGKLYTYYAKTKEPMFVYTLISKFDKEYDTELTVRVDGTLDDKTSSTIVMRKNAIPQQALTLVGKWICTQSINESNGVSYTNLSAGKEINTNTKGQTLCVYIYL